MNHTKGEWNVGKRTNDLEVTISTKSKRICEVKSYSMDGFSDPSTKEATANAKLIVQAPKMLKAMILFCDRVDKGEIRSKKTYASFKEIIKATE